MSTGAAGMSEELEPQVVWMVEMMLGPNTKPNRLAFVNRFEELSRRYGHAQAVAALNEADRRASIIEGSVMQEATS